MTRNEFFKVLIRLNPNNEDTLEHTHNLPMIASFTAAHCFVHDRKGMSSQYDHDLCSLRDQLLALEKSGCFNFENE